MGTRVATITAFTSSAQQEVQCGPPLIGQAEASLITSG
jgi:hypothetical protein